MPKGRFVEHANGGGVWTFAVEPDETGTMLSAAFGWSSKVPRVAEVMDCGWNGDSDLDAMLANLKKAIETQRLRPGPPLRRLCIVAPPQ